MLKPVDLTRVKDLDIITAEIPNQFLLLPIVAFISLLGIAATVYVLVMLHRISRDIKKILEKK